jgi:C2H2 type zinc finger protein
MVLSMNVFVYFFLIQNINLLCSNLICFRQQTWLKRPQAFEIFAVSLMPRTFKERNIPCTICGRKFTNRAGLTNHQRVHRKPSLKKVNPSQPALQMPSRSPSVHSFGQPDDAGIQALPEDGPLPLPQPRISETVTYHPFINGTLDLLSFRFWFLTFLKDCPVILTVNFCLKDHPHHLGITHNQPISHPSKTVLHLNWRTFFFAESKCQVVTSMIYSKSGLRHFPLTKIHPSTANKICMTRWI